MTTSSTVFSLKQLRSHSSIFITLWSDWRSLTPYRTDTHSPFVPDSQTPDEFVWLPVWKMPWSVTLITFLRLHMTIWWSSPSRLLSHGVLYKPGLQKIFSLLSLEREANLIMAFRTAVVACALFLGLCIITNGKPFDTHAYCKIVW